MEEKKTKVVMVLAHPDDEIIFGWPICLNNFDQRHFVYQDGPRSERLRAMISSCTKSLKAAIRLEWRSSSG